MATLVVNSDDGLQANHIPLLLAERKPGNFVLQGHIAAANPLWKIGIQGDVLAIFQGPAAYVTPSWYPSKQEHGKVVPTWNYTAVHATGELSFIHDNDWKLDLVQRLTEQMEASKPQPWKVSDAPKAFTQKLLPAIVGFEIAVVDMVGKWKVSQNQPEANQQGVREGLEAAGHADAAMLSGR